MLFDWISWFSFNLLLLLDKYIITVYTETIRILLYIWTKKVDRKTQSHSKRWYSHILRWYVLMDLYPKHRRIIISLNSTLINILHNLRDMDRSSKSKENTKNITLKWFYKSISFYFVMFKEYARPQKRVVGYMNPSEPHSCRSTFETESNSPRD